jgi:hypothetical protein
MEPVILPILGFVTLAAILIVVSIVSTNRRREALRTVAGQLGFTFAEKLAPGQNGFGDRRHIGDFIRRFEGFSPFGTGDARVIYNLIHGTRDGIDWTLFDYKYETESTDSEGRSETTTHRYGVVAARLPLIFPGISLAPESVFHRIGAALGFSDLQFEFEEFNRRYYVRGKDPKPIYDLVHPKAIEYFMRLPVRHWQMGGNTVLIVKMGSFSAEELPIVMQEIEGFLKLVPEYYRQDHASATRWDSALAC